MKTIVCEMCGSNDVIKKDGLYVCQHCGTKYDPEEAKKLMVEVKIDNSAKIQNLYQLARRAYQDKNYEEAAKYYSQITVDVPNDWEAYFFSVFCKQSTCKVAEIPLAASTIANCLDSTAELIENSTDMDKIAKQQAFLDITKAIDDFGATILYAAANAYAKPPFTDFAKESLHNCIRESMLLRIKGCSITDVGINGKHTDTYCNVCKDAIEMNNSYKSTVGDVLTKQERDYLRASVKDVNPNFVMPEDSVGQTSDTNKKSSGGCYVATAVYGSYDCPQVWTLRRYRDYTLAESWFGRLFITLYYAISPTLVKWFGGTEWFKNLWKPQLDRMVRRLNVEGVADTPYLDREW